MAGLLAPRGESNSSSGGDGGSSSGGGSSNDDGDVDPIRRDSETGERLDFETGEPIDTQSQRTTDVQARNASGGGNESNLSENTQDAPSTGGNQPRADMSDAEISTALSKARDKALKIQQKLEDRASNLREEEGSADPEEGVAETSDEARQEEEDVRNDIETLTNPGAGIQEAREASERYTEILQQQQENIAKRREQRTQEIEQEFAAEKRQTRQEQEQEFAQQRSQLVRAGGFLGGSASAQGTLQRLNETHRQEVAALEAKKSSAISEAQRAFSKQQVEVAKSMAKQAINLENTINKRRQQNFNNSLSILQEKRQQDQADLTEETQKLKNAQTRAELMAPTIASNISQAGEEEKQALLAGYAEEYGIDQEVLAGKVQEFQSEQTAQQLENQTSRARLRKINQELSQGDIVSQESYTGPDGNKKVSYQIRQPDGSITNRVANTGVQASQTSNISDASSINSGVKSWASEFIGLNPDATNQDLAVGIQEKTELSGSEAMDLVEAERGEGVDVIPKSTLKSEAAKAVAKRYSNPWFGNNAEENLDVAKEEAKKNIDKQTVINDQPLGLERNVNKLEEALDGLTLEEIKQAKKEAEEDN